MVQVQLIVVWRQMQDVCRWLITLRIVLSTGRSKGDALVPGRKGETRVPLALRSDDFDSLSSLQIIGQSRVVLRGKEGAFLESTLASVTVQLDQLEQPMLTT